MDNKDRNFSESWYGPVGPRAEERAGGIPTGNLRDMTGGSNHLGSAGADNSTHQPPPRTADLPPQPAYTDPYWSCTQPPARKSHTRMKIVMLTLCVLVLIVASALIFMTGDDPGESLLFNFGSDNNPVQVTPPWQGEYDEDYHDFFNGYYEPAAPGSSAGIPQADVGTGVTLDLVPADTGEPMTLQEIYRTCSPSVVGITAEVDGAGYYWGTGIIMTEDGYIVTNAHVLEGTDSVTVTLADDREFEALLVGSDAQSDLAVLKVDARRLPVAEFGNSDSLLVGDDVVAIGNPLSQELRGTMTDGIISAISRDIDYNGHTMTLLQTNAAINDGNSGGPLINMYGQVIGITNMKMVSYYSSIEGIGFAIPTVSIKPIVDELIEKGYVTGRTAIGVTIGSIPASAASYYTLPDGLYVSSVVGSSDAYRQGVRAGDIITAVNGQSVYTTEDVYAIKDGLSVGDTLTLTIYRSGDTFDVDIMLMEATELYN
jgi:serine protease Do